MTRVGRAAVGVLTLAGGVLLVDVVVITIRGDSFGTADDVLWAASVLLTPIALVLTATVLSRGARHRWAVGLGVLVLVVVVIGALAVLGQAVVDATYDGSNKGLTWEAGNYVVALLLLVLAVVVARRGRR